MEWDDVKPKPAVVTVGDNLASLSILELESRVQTFEDEIERVRQEIARKRAHEQSAKSIFKT